MPLNPSRVAVDMITGGVDALASGLHVVLCGMTSTAMIATGPVLWRTARVP